MHPTALIPTWFGLALGVFGLLAISPSERRRKLFMHINVTIGLVGFLGAAIEAVRGYVNARCQPALRRIMIALASKLAMAGLLLIYVILCVRSFIDARRIGEGVSVWELCVAGWAWACTPSARRTGAERAPARRTCPRASPI